MEVLTGALHVIGIKSEVAVLRCVLSDPGKRLNPRIFGNPTGEFQVWRSRKCLPLHIEHEQSQRNKEQQQSKDVSAQDMTADQTAGNQNKDQVKQMQVAHRLQGLQTLQASGQHDD